MWYFICKNQVNKTFFEAFSFNCEFMAYVQEYQNEDYDIELLMKDLDFKLVIFNDN